MGAIAYNNGCASNQYRVYVIELSKRVFTENYTII